MADSMVKRGERMIYPRSRMYDLMDRWMDDLFDEPFMSRIQPEEWRMQAFGPSVDVIEQDDRIIVNAEAPGMDPEDINVSLSENAITISGEKRCETEQDIQGRRYSERSYGSFRRVIPMPSDVDRDRVEARFKHGLLTLTIPKLQTALEKTRKIPIKTDFSEASTHTPAKVQDLETAGAEEAIRQMENPPGQEQFLHQGSSKDPKGRQPADPQDLETAGAEEAIRQMTTESTKKSR